MAISHVQNVGSDASNSSLTATVTLTHDVPAGDALVAYIMAGNSNTSSEGGPYFDANRMHVDDDGGNRWVVQGWGEWPNASANARPCYGVATCVLDTAMAAGQTITFTLELGSARRIAVSVEQFTGLTKKNLAWVQLTHQNATSSAPANLSISGALSREYIMVHAMVGLTDAGQTWTKDADYTAITAVPTPDTAFTLFGAYRVATLTGDTVSSSFSASISSKQWLGMLRETDQPGVRTFSSLTGTSSGLTLDVTGCRKGDVVVMFVGGQTSNYYPDVAAAGCDGGGRVATADGYVTMYWKRIRSDAEGEDSYGFGDFGNCNTGFWMALHGCDPDGDPFEILSSETETATDATATFSGGATTDDDALLIFACSHGRDGSGGTLSSPANANLGSFVEIVDATTTLANGWGLGVMIAQAPAAGNIGTTDWTLSVATEQKALIAIAGRDSGYTRTAPDMETVKYFSLAASGSVTWPAGTFSANDLIVVAIKHGGGSPQPTGYTQIGTTQTTGSTNISVYYKVADGSETGVTIPDTTDQAIGRVYRVTGADPSDPIDATAGGTDATASSTLVAGDLTTTGDNRRFALFSAVAKDYIQAGPTSWVNSNLVPFFKDGTNRIKQHGASNTTDGAGGGVNAGSGVKSAAGAVGNTTLTYYWADSTNVAKAWVSVAFNPVPTETDVPVSQVTETDTAQALTRRKSKSVLQDTETDAAQTVTPSVIISPASDVSAGTWTPSSGIDLYAMIDEHVRSDSDYITSGVSPASPDVTKIRLESSGVPGAGPCTVAYAYKKDAAGGDAIDLTVGLYLSDGTTLVKENVHSGISDTIVESAIELTESEAGAISSSDWSAGLVVIFEAVAS